MRRAVTQREAVRSIPASTVRQARPLAATQSPLTTPKQTNTTPHKKDNGPQTSSRRIYTPHLADLALVAKLTKRQFNNDKINRKSFCNRFFQFILRTHTKRTTLVPCQYFITLFVTKAQVCKGFVSIFN